MSRDKTFQWYCTKTGRKLGSFESQSWCLDVVFDASSKYAFVADYGGQINVMKLETQGFTLITTLKGHQSEWGKEEGGGGGGGGGGGMKGGRREIWRGEGGGGGEEGEGRRRSQLEE